MNDSITCPHCQKKIPLTEAITHQIADQYKNEIEALKKKQEAEKQDLREKAKKWKEEEIEKMQKQTEEKVKVKVAKEMAYKLKESAEEAKDLEKKNDELHKELLDLTKEIRATKDAAKDKERELEKKFSDQQEKLRKEEQKRVEEQFKLQLLEKEKKLNDAMKANEELQRKLKQGSQQLQGEVLELSIEEELGREFPLDTIEPVPKGVSGADIVQHVRTRSGTSSGIIVWETKRTKTWSSQWVTKLKSDQRTVHAEIAVLVSAQLPDEIKHFGEIDGVWVCGFEHIIPIAYALRTQLMEIAKVKTAMTGQKGKMEALYEYVYSTDFKHRMEAIVETFSQMQEEVEKERRWFNKKWAREEQNLRRALDHTFGMRGDFQSIIGKSFDDDDTPQLIDGEENDMSHKKSKEQEEELF
ncbi:DUF2130 domain-containing protein [Candidatus Woesebacteria bacterium]|nr:DUF2130 domain-containing protein [Candidatus Woesebacteria bacterium]